MSFPWGELMAAACRGLHMSPDEFWKLSPRELFACLPRAGAGLPRAAFEQLMEQFPDEPAAGI